MFSGLKGYLYMKHHGIPMSLFKQWLREKWIADLKTLAWCIPMLPMLALWLVGAGLMMLGSGLILTKKLLPDGLFLPVGLRDKQIQIATVARAHVADTQQNGPTG